MSDESTKFWPIEIRVQSEEKRLEIEFDNGEAFSIPAELLRVESPSAEVQGHGPGQETLVLGKQQVMITAVEPIGQYAIRLVFDDGHDTGLYTWKYLRELGAEHATRWTAYLQKVRDRLRSGSGT